MLEQNDLIVIVRIRDGSEDGLSRILEEIYEDLNDSEEIPFAKLTLVHFIRWAILPPETSRVDGRRYPASLLLSSNFDGSPEEHLRELISLGRDAIDRIYECCEGYPEGAERVDDRRIGYLLKNALDHSEVSYRGHPGLTADQIRLDRALRMRIDRFVAEEDLADLAPLQIRDAIRKKLESEASSSGPSRDLWAGVEARVPLVPQGFSSVEKLLGGVLFVLAAPFLAVWLILIRLKEQRDSWEPVAGTRSGLSDPAATREREDFITQNQFTHVIELKPGYIRKATLQAILFVIETAGSRYFTRGHLGGVSTLHFVSWTLIDDGRRLLFLSNYDGSALHYVADFVDRAELIPLALSALWSNTIGFPPTRWLIGEGARHLPPFLAFLREHQLHAPVWFSAYPDLTTGNIISNEKLRRGLSAELTQEKAEDWVRLI